MASSSPDDIKLELDAVAAAASGGNGGGAPGGGGGAPRECRICLSADDQDDLISPCLCSGTSKWVHRACLDRWRAVKHQTSAFTHCTECRFEFWITLRENRSRSWRKAKPVPSALFPDARCAPSATARARALPNRAPDDVGTGALADQRWAFLTQADARHACSPPSPTRFRALVARDTLVLFMLLQLAIFLLGGFVYLLDTDKCLRGSPAGNGTLAPGQERCLCVAPGAPEPPPAERGLVRCRYGPLVLNTFAPAKYHGRDKAHAKAAYYGCGIVLFLACIGLAGACMSCSAATGGRTRGGPQRAAAHYDPMLDWDCTPVNIFSAVENTFCGLNAHCIGAQGTARILILCGVLRNFATTGCARSTAWPARPGPGASRGVRTAT